MRHPLSMKYHNKEQPLTSGPSPVSLSAFLSAPSTHSPRWFGEAQQVMQRSALAYELETRLHEAARVSITKYIQRKSECAHLVRMRCFHLLAFSPGQPEWTTFDGLPKYIASSLCDAATDFLTQSYNSVFEKALGVRC